VIIQARVGSTRLPNKIMKNLRGKPELEHVFNRCKATKADEVIIATSKKKENDAIEKFCKEREINFFRGSENDVLDRFYNAAIKYKLDIIVRVTGDCPLISPEVINTAIEEFKKLKVDYLSNAIKRSYPRGLDVEIFNFETLKKTHKLAKKKTEREHVTSFIYSNPEKFKIVHLIVKGWLNRPEMRLCIDTNEDLNLLEIIYNNLNITKDTPIKEVISFLNKHPKLIAMNNQSEIEQRDKNKIEGVNQDIFKTI
jgi:spore coat polysaccharide biosynthesis protein SpsF (cytidylyltransferase family)